jgi:hypothetical protein
MAQGNQPRNKYGIEVTRPNKKPFQLWYPSAAARDLVWAGFNKTEPETLLEAVGIK